MVGFSPAGKANKPTERGSVMKTIVKFVAMPIMMMILTGCASTHPNVITPELKQTVKSVSIVNEVHAPASITFPLANNPLLGLGAVGMMIAQENADQAAKPFNNQLHSKMNVDEYLSQTLLSTFQTRMASVSAFTLKTNEIADAAFVLEVTYAGLGFQRTVLQKIYPPEVEVVVTLIANPPFKLIKDQSGKMTTDDPVRHAILYRKVVRLKGGYDIEDCHKAEEYLSKDVFEKAFEGAIYKAVNKITSDW